MTQGQRPAAYAIKLMNQFEQAVREHVAANEYGQCSLAEQQRYEKAKDRLARKIGQLAADAAKNEANAVGKRSDLRQ